MRKDKDKEKEKGEVSRRDFLTGAGALVVGGPIGAGITYPLVAGKDGEVTTKTVEVTKTIETTKTVEVPTTVTSTLPGTTVTTTKPDGTVTTTVTTTVPEEAAPTNVVNFTVNGEQYELKVEPNWTLTYVLREKLGLAGVKDGCDRGECGTCTVIVDGKAVYSCMMLAIEAEGKEILTIEGLSDNINLHPVQQAFVDNDAVQCGFCVPGFILMAKSLLDENPNPTLDEVREGLSGHICPCGNSKNMVEAVLAAKGGG